MRFCVVKEEQRVPGSDLWFKVTWQGNYEVNDESGDDMDVYVDSETVEVSDNDCNPVALTPKLEKLALDNILFDENDIDIDWDMVGRDD